MGRFNEIIDKYGKRSSSSSNIETKPKRRTAEEIRDKYRKTGPTPLPQLHTPETNL